MEKITRVFRGEMGTQAFDGWAGFRIGQTYELRIARQENGDVDIVIDQSGRDRELTLTQQQFERWFEKP